MQVFISSFILVSLFSIVKMSDGIISKVDKLKITEDTKNVNPQKKGEATLLDDYQDENNGDETLEAKDDATLKPKDDETLKVMSEEKATFAEIFGRKGVVSEDLSDISDAEETSDSDSDEQDAKETTTIRAIATESKELISSDKDKQDAKETTIVGAKGTESKELSSSDSDKQDAKETTIVGVKGTESKEINFKIPYDVSSGKDVPKKETLV